MSNQPDSLTDLSEEELLGKRKSARAIIGVMIAVAVLYLGYFVYLMMSGSFNTNEHLPLITIFAVLPITVLPAKKNLDQVNHELKRRSEGEKTLD